MRLITVVDELIVLVFNNTENVLAVVINLDLVNKLFVLGKENLKLTDRFGVDLLVVKYSCQIVGEEDLIGIALEFLLCLLDFITTDLSLLQQKAFLKVNLLIIDIKVIVDIDRQGNNNQCSNGEIYFFH